jgi:nicotinamidase-related amidase
VTDTAQTLPTALLVIDVQEAMFGNDEEPPVHEPDRLVNNINMLLEKARAAGAKVIYIRHNEPRYEPMRRGSPGWQIRAAIAPQEGELILDKSICDSFTGTNLDDVLKDAGVTSFVTCGIQTDMCVGSATRSGLNRGYRVILAGDSHSTWDFAGLTAQQIIAFTNAQLGNTSGPGDITVRNAADIEFASA